MKPITLRELMEHHEPAARRLAEQHALGAMQSRSYDGRPGDPVRTAILTYRFERGTITYDSTAGADYHVERNIP